ncbi:MAG: tetratricopeptide repeat protein, partial [Planctomycetales bacterium]
MPMWFNRIPVGRILIGLLIITPCVVAVYFNSGTAESQLLLAREEAQKIVDSSKSRSLSAERCIAIASRLFDTEGRVGATANLYYIGAAPIVGADLSVASIPPGSDVLTIETADLLLISELLFHTDRLGPAEQLIGVALDRGESRAATLRLAIEIRLELGSDAEVMQHTEEWVNLEPNNPKPFRIQAAVHRNHGRWDNFIVAAEKAVELTSPTDWVLQVELVDGYTHLGKIDDARRELNRIKEARPDLVKLAPVMHARLLLQEGDHEAAEEIIDRCLVAYPDDTEAMLVKGKLRVALGDYSQAIDMFEKLQEIDPADEQAYYQLGQAHARVGDKDQGRKYLEQHRRLLDAKIE